MQVAIGDVNGDGIPDVIVAPGVGQAPIDQDLQRVDRRTHVSVHGSDLDVQLRARKWPWAT